MKEKFGPDVNTDNSLPHWGRSVGFGQNPIPLARSSQLITASREPGPEHMAPTIAHLSCSVEPCLVASVWPHASQAKSFQKSNQTVKSRILGPAQWEDEWPTYQGLLHKAAVSVFSLGYENRPHLFQGRLKRIVTHSLT